jgi:hypothetical protein
MLQTITEVVLNSKVNNIEKSIIKKVPSKDELRAYLKSMIYFDNLGNDSYGLNMGCSIAKTYQFICKNYFNEYFVEGPIDTFMDGSAIGRYDKIIKLIEYLSDDDIKFILVENNVYPEFIYGIRNDEGHDNYFGHGYTNVLEIDYRNSAVMFECYMSELQELANKDVSISKTCREIKLLQDNKFVLRYLDHSPYLVFDFNGRYVEEEEDYMSRKMEIKYA